MSLLRRRRHRHLPRRRRSPFWIALTAAVATTPAVRAADLFRDDFNGAALDTGNTWNIGNWQLGRTQLGLTPSLSGGNAELLHDTYNPSNPGGTFKGTEIYSQKLFTRGSGPEFEARVRTNTPMPSGLVTSFFTYNFVPGSPNLADEIDFEFLTQQINASAAGTDPVLATTWNNYRTNGTNFDDPNVHSSQNINVTPLDLSQFNTFKIRWLPDRVEWYVNDVPLRTSLYAVPDLAAPIRANFWAPAGDWPDAYNMNFKPTATLAANQSYKYDVDYIAVRRMYGPVAATGRGRVFTDNFKNGAVADSDSVAGFWTQRNQGSGGGVTSNVSETAVVNADDAYVAQPLSLTAGGAGFPHAQIASSVRSEFNLFRNPVAIEATGIGFSSTSNSTTVNTIGKSILRFVLSSQTLTANTQSEYTSSDALALRIEGGNLVALGYKVNAPNNNTEFNNNLVSQTVSGPVRHVYLVCHGSFYFLQVEHDASNTDSTQVTSEFSGAMNLNLSDWSASGDSAMYIQGQLNNSGANENMTALVGSVAVSAVKPAWNVNATGNWSAAGNWTDRPAPNYRGATAQFTSAINGPRTVTTDIPVTAGTLIFDNSTASYTITGAGPITLDTYLGGATIQVLSGSHAITTPIVLNRDTTIDVAGGSSISLSGDLTGQTFAVSKIGGGDASLKNVRTSGPLSVNAGRLAMLPNGTSAGTSHVGALSVAPGAKLDLADNKLITSSPVAAVTSLIVSGRNGGVWNGSGIITSQSNAAGGLTSIGVAAASQVKGIAATATSTWAGQTVSGSETLVMYTYAGDATLDGKINVDDYGRIDFNVNLAGATGWYNGDFNYDGKVNVDDYGIIDSNVPIQGAAFPTGGAAGVSAVTAIPEAGSLGLLLVAQGFGLTRRLRRRVR
jgi:beta-glucanase (GH16 family)